MSIRYLNKTIAAVLCLAALGAVPAQAAPVKPALGPFIEDGSDYDGQSKCSPYAKPGVVAFQRMVLAAYPGTGAGSISRACSVGGTSEHKEGRAWDWGVNVGVPSQRAAAGSMLDWLADTDAYGNRAAMARRLGVMYAIWNRRIWFPSGGWRTYCVERRGACRDPEDGDIRHPHTDHVHFSFTWAGARKQTTFWNRRKTLASSAVASPSGGVLVAGRNGGVMTLGPAWYHGSKSGDYLNGDVVSIETTPTGNGYWMLTSKGRVFAFGEARNRGSLKETRAAAIASTPSGKGYWILAKGGRVAPFGDALKLGSPEAGQGPFVSITPTPTGVGYWLVSGAGTVHAFGDAVHLGDARSNDAVSMTATASGLGYWLVNRAGKVQAFGDATSMGEIPGDPTSPTVAIVPSQTGAGYWLVNERGAARAFGDAAVLRRNVSASIGFSVQDVLGSISE
ncbi:MAG TPA: hypothetical protein VJ927_02905 [Actinomycetota bacterium]|nr:hypothetical protein [Actinomycetota bacterium]